MQMMMFGPYADPTSAIWAWNLVGYIACICCLWNSNYVEPHRHSNWDWDWDWLRVSRALSVRSERWKVRYPPPRHRETGRFTLWQHSYDCKTNKQTHTHRPRETLGDAEIERRMLSKPFCSAHCLACHAKAIYCRFAPKIESGLCAFIDR